MILHARADPGIFARGGPRPTARKKLWQRSFFFFLVLNFFYSVLSMVYFKENYNFQRFQRGSNIFQGGDGGSNIFQVGSKFFQGV